MSGEAKTQQQKITSVQDMVNYTMGTVTLPPFGNGMPCVVRLKRVSVLAMAKQGKIPNQLMGTVVDLFDGASKKAAGKDKQENDLQSTSEILELFANASLVEPTYKELQDAGVDLTDLQLAAIFSYSQSGVRDLERFPEV